MMINFNKAIRTLDNGFIAVVDEESPEHEKTQAAQFSYETRNMLGFENPLGGEQMPIIGASDWTEDLENDLGPRKLHVFVLVLEDKIVGYLPIMWHYSIIQNGQLLSADGKPCESSGGSRVYTYSEFLSADFSDEPKTLEFWGVEAILILPEFQRRGLGTLLLKTALKYLGTNEREIAYDDPLTPEGKALIRSLGLNPKDIRYSPGL